MQWMHERKRLGRSGRSPAEVPVRARVPAVEALLDAYAAEHGAEWSFANVYAADDETPLGWWE